MSFKSRFRRVVLVMAVWLSLVAPVRAENATKAECVADYTGAQEQRAAGHLLEARETLVRCAKPECPAFIESDCGRWLIEVDRETPTIVIAARGRDGSDTVDVRVLVDGQPFLEAVSGQAVPIDPGQHTLRFEYADAEPIERSLVLRMGQKNRTVNVDFSDVAEPTAEPEPSAYDEPAEMDTVAPARPGPLRPYAFVAGGVGGVGLAGWAVFSILGKGEQSDLEATCSPNCTDSEVQPVRTKYLIANVSLGVGLAGLAAGTALFFISRPKASSRAAWSVGVEPARGGALGSVSGKF